MGLLGQKKKRKSRKNKKDAKVCQLEENVSNRHKHRGFEEKNKIKIKMAGPVFNVSTNKCGRKLLSV